ncbi:MAG: biopolymer transporter ExbD [Gammaproteobacteria bacterium]|nr:biopolymer transporter ExbD [Gammaproteobacteria bacterium]
MRKRISRARHKEAEEMNITAFMNLMVVLVPFLLITAVFTHLSIIELHLPGLGDSSANKKDKPEFNLQITIRNDALLLSDTQGGLIRKIDKAGKTFDYKILNTTLQQVKARFPDKTNATILAEPNTEYDTLVQVMDSVRMYTAVVDGNVVQAELFPDISIGDAPR